MVKNHEYNKCKGCEIRFLLNIFFLETYTGSKLVVYPHKKNEQKLRISRELHQNWNELCHERHIITTYRWLVTYPIEKRTWRTSNHNVVEGEDIFGNKHVHGYCMSTIRHKFMTNNTKYNLPKSLQIYQNMFDVKKIWYVWDELFRSFLKLEVFNFLKNTRNWKKSLFS